MKQTHENATVKYPAQLQQVKAGSGVVIICRFRISKQKNKMILDLGIGSYTIINGHMRGNQSSEKEGIMGRAVSVILLVFVACSLEANVEPNSAPKDGQAFSHPEDQYASATDTCPDDPQKCAHSEASTIDTLEPGAALSDDGNLSTKDEHSPAVNTSSDVSEDGDDQVSATDTSHDVSEDTDGQDILTETDVQKQCNDDDPSTLDWYDSATGECRHLTSGCDDSNPCTDDYDDPATGICYHFAKNCDDDDPSTLDWCDIKTGECRHEKR